MRALLVAGVAVAAVLVPAAPASTGDLRTPAAPVPAEPSRPAPLVPFGPAPDDGCTVPVGATLEACPPGGRSRPPVSCVLPVARPHEPVVPVPPNCPRPRPTPEGRVVPLSR